MDLWLEWVGQLIRVTWTNVGCHDTSYDDVSFKDLGFFLCVTNLQYQRHMVLLVGIPVYVVMNESALARTATSCTKAFTFSRVDFGTNLGTDNIVRKSFVFPGQENTENMGEDRLITVLNNHPHKCIITHRNHQGKQVMFLWLQTNRFHSLQRVKKWKDGLCPPTLVIQKYTRSPRTTGPSAFSSEKKHSQASWLFWVVIAASQTRVQIA